MLIVIYGTTGELIKLLPLLKALDRNQYVTICTYQQPQQLKQLFKLAKLPEPDIKIGQSETASDLEKMINVPWWFIRTVWGFLKNWYLLRKKIKRDKKPSVLLVHGDTMTTVVGASMGRLLRWPVGHIEAGLRSYNWRHPFPEEIDRVVTSKLARYHFAPGQVPVENLRRANIKGEIISTHYNTVLDSLRLAKVMAPKLRIKLPKRYGVVSIHRNELLARPAELEALLKPLGNFSEELPLVFLDHPVTKERLKKLGFDELLNHKNILRIPKLNYMEFIEILVRAECVVTDSGGLQEETAYLGIPCLIHRKATERQEGLGENVVLSGYSQEKIRRFMASYPKYRRPPIDEKVQPTQIIIDKLRAMGYIE